ncbi:MAG: hypothetical protein ACI814_002773, partial [Mariniblastus sp.]
LIRRLTTISQPGNAPFNGAFFYALMVCVGNSK